jgi:hypothetical protein
MHNHLKSEHPSLFAEMGSSTQTKKQRVEAMKDVERAEQDFATPKKKKVCRRLIETMEGTGTMDLYMKYASGDLR